MERRFSNGSTKVLPVNLRIFAWPRVVSEGPEGKESFVVQAHGIDKKNFLFLQHCSFVSLLQTAIFLGFQVLSKNYKCHNMPS